MSENERVLLGMAISRSKRAQPVLKRVYKGRKPTPCSDEKRARISRKLSGRKLELSDTARIIRSEAMKRNRRDHSGPYGPYKVVRS